MSWNAKWIVSASAVAVALLSSLPSTADARPFRGTTKVYVILCQTSDSPAPARSAADFRRMLFQGGTGGLADYWHDVTYANFNNAGSEVHGWFRLSQTTAQFSKLARFDRVNACLDAARTAKTGAVTVPANAIRYIVTSPAVDLFGWAGGAFLPVDTDIGAVAHEGGHGIALDHSFSNDPKYRNADWAQIGEYDDPWDVMSWGNAFRVPTPFGDGPAGLIGPHLDRMGWLPRNRTIRHGANDVVEVTYTLAALGHPEVPGALLVRVPFDPGDLFRYYTVEFRHKSRWDNGIPADTILIHEVRRRNGAGETTPQQIAFLQRDLAKGDRAPRTSLSANGVSITLVSINSAARQATVRVRSEITIRCVVGFVWREARSGDTVCVTPGVRAETRKENEMAASRRSPTGGPFGPDTCLQGFVWREAFPNDHVCVPPASRTRARDDNAKANERRNPARNAFGPNTCKQGFVWREADQTDWVCVSPATRTRTRNENNLATSRRSPTGGAFGPDTCLQGFVWREAFPNDHVCVPTASRTEARNDNAQASNRLAIP
jgi:hypothetical protein